MMSDFGLGRVWQRLGLGGQVALALLVAVVLAWPARGSAWGGHLAAAGDLLGMLFVGALKAVAPVLVFVLVAAALARHRAGSGSGIRPVLVLYVVGMLLAALVAVSASFLFPSVVPLSGIEAASRPVPAGVGEVLRNLAGKLAANPIQALAEANYVGILVWAVLLGLALRHASEATRDMLADAAEAVSRVVRWIIRLAPLGIFGLVLTTVSNTGLESLAAYLHVLAVIVGAMVFTALVVNPLIVWMKIRRNPYPLVWTCLKESGLIAFFVRSSVANIPVNLALCKKLGLDEETYSVSIPLGATMNMEGASITITILTLAAVHTLGIPVDFLTAFLLVLVAVVGACGASGVPGGSLPLVPMACSLFNIDHDVAMQMVAVGLIIMVVQDPCGTMLNSSTDVVFTAAADPSYQQHPQAAAEPARQVS